MRKRSEIIQHCSTVIRKHQSGSWITADMKKAYKKQASNGIRPLYRNLPSKKIGKCLYGLAIGKIFCGESLTGITQKFRCFW